MAKKSVKKAKSGCCVCGHNCHDKHANLPAYLLIAFGLLVLPINMGMLPQNLDWLKAWPLLLVLFGFVALARTAICRSKSRKR
jgi:uncharacterized protein (DUF983 family)